VSLRKTNLTDFDCVGQKNECMTLIGSNCPFFGIESLAVIDESCHDKRNTFDYACDDQVSLCEDHEINETQKRFVTAC
jgi:hypothetical protein